MMDFLQINKARGGDAVVSVTSEETRLAMLGQTISILGKDYKVSAPRTGGKTRKTNTKKQNGVDELYYMDIVGTRYNFDSLALLKGLRRLKTNPLYVTYKSTYDQKQNGSPAHPNIWRVYFNTEEQPPALTVNGLVIEEIVLQGVRYGVFVKNYVRQTTQRNGRESQHCIDFDKLLNAGTEQGQSQQPEDDTFQKKQRRASVDQDSPDQQLPSPEANAAQNQTTLLQEEPSTGHNNPDQHTLPGETTTAPQTAQAAFQSMVEEMEIDAFVQPKKTVKLKAAKRSR
ncbi:hypothetical protein AeMF1_007770, partial [Aphanomyces euteiches]